MYGISGIEYKFLSSYFSNRKQYVMFNNKNSEFTEMRTSVPSSSNLCIVLYCVVLYCIVSYRIASHRIASHRIASHRIVLYMRPYTEGRLDRYHIGIPRENPKSALNLG